MNTTVCRKSDCRSAPAYAVKGDTFDDTFMVCGVHLKWAVDFLGDFDNKDYPRANRFAIGPVAAAGAVHAVDLKGVRT